MVKEIPCGMTSVTPHLVVNGGLDALDFYVKAFDAEIVSSLPGPNNLLMHAEIKIGNAMVMFGSNQWGEQGPKAPIDLGGHSGNIHLYVDDADKTYKQALAAGASEIMPPMDTFWGSRYGQVKDPSGNVWAVATHLEDLSAEEIQKRGQEWLKSMEQ